MNARNFNEDLKTYDNNQLRKSWETIFQKEFGQDIEIKWKDDLDAQIDFGTDVLIKTKKGRKYSIDIKGRNPKYNGLQQWTIEIVHQYYQDSSRGKHLGKKEGWLYCSTADFIFYGTANEQFTGWTEYVGFSLKPFKDDEFKSNLNGLYYTWTPTQFTNKFQLTLCKIVSYDFLKKHADKFWYWRDIK
jgi:hypothetical protein